MDIFRNLEILTFYTFSQFSNNYVQLKSVKILIIKISKI